MNILVWLSLGQKRRRKTLMRTSSNAVAPSLLSLAQNLTINVCCHLCYTFIFGEDTSYLSIRPTKIISFQIKIMSGIPKLSNTSPIPALYFLPWELLADGIVHINTPNLPSYLEQPRHNSLKECLVHPHDVQEQLNHMEQPPIALQEVFPAISSCSSAKWISLV